MTDAQQFDVVIAGGGLVGGSLAIALAQTRCRVALVEAVPPAAPQHASFDDRTLALARGSCKVLQQLGVWERIAANVWPIRRIHVSQQATFGTAMIDADEQGIHELGYVIKSRELGQAIWARIRDLPDIEVFCPARVTATEVLDDRRIVTLTREPVAENSANTHTDSPTQKLSAALLVVADGARSQLRASLGIGATERNYEQVAVVAPMRIAASRSGHTAYERFTEQGPLAVLPGKDGQYTLVLARNESSVDAIMSMSDDALIATVHELFGLRLGRIGGLGRRQAYPLSLVTADAVSAERAVLVGNAANGLHPVAAQGFNLGMRDVASLAELIANAERETDAFDAGSSELIAAYVGWRESDQQRVVRFTDGLIRFFGAHGAAAAAMRGMGLVAFDMLPVAKRELARQTMGLAGRMTRLARGLPL